MKLTTATYICAILLVTIFLATSSFSSTPEPRSDANFVRGIVFNDENGNEIRDDGEKGVSGVCVSNGLDVVETDCKGSYELTYDDDTIIFIIKPRDWKTPVDENNLPKFHYIHKPGGSPESKYPGVQPTGPLPDSVDFPLRYEEEPATFRAVIFGDTQARDLKEVDYMTRDVVEELIGVDAEFGVTLGDIAFNDLSIFDRHNETLGKIGIPWHNVQGNHDTNQDSPDDKQSDETFERIYGPPYYSYNYGDVHFVVLDDVLWNGNDYDGGFDDKQLEFVKNELAFVPDDKLVVLMMHIPLSGMAGRFDILPLIDKREHTLSLSAHWHRQVNYFLGPLSGWYGEGRHHHMVCGTVCGSWWSGAPDEYGIPHTTMPDGTPNGYLFIDFNGNEYSIEYKVARREASYQMNIYAPEEISSSDAGSTKVMANIFAGSERSFVEMKFGENGEWVEMKRFPMKDPSILRIKEAEQSDNPPPGRKLPDPNPSLHIWVTKLPPNPEPGPYVIHVRTTDVFGHEYTGSRIIRIN